jgi:LPS sulfotransferase NodH
MSRDSGTAPGPIFIMGNHRSGTTWLHLLLAETGCFAYVTAFHVIASSTLNGEPTDVA